MKTVLVVDDTPDNVTLLVNLLKDRYRVKVATSGESALRVMDHDPLPDLVLLDIMMPGMNGFEVCTRIQGNARTRHVPVVFLSAMSQPVEVEFGRALSEHEYLVKPVDPERLYQTLSSVLGE